MVPGGGFEPPTRGFSVHCSTPELPGHRINLSALRMGNLGERARYNILDDQV